MKYSTRAVLLSLLIAETAQGFTSRQSLHPFPSPTTTRSSISSSICRPATIAPAVNGQSKAAPEENEDEDNMPSLDVRLNIFEKARTVTSVSTSGTLSTVSRHEGIDGAPFGSFVDFVLDDSGNPVFLMNEMSMHTINVEEATKLDGKAAMVTLFTQLSGGVLAGASAEEMQDVSRCSLTGPLEKISPKDAEDMDALRMRYSIAHSYADQVMDSPKFAFYRLTPKRIYYVGGFGVSSQWVDVDEYKAANPDILAKEASQIVTKINREHVDDLLLTGEHLLDVKGIERIRVTNVDRLGMDVRVTAQASATRRSKLITDEFRIGFRIPVISVEDAKSEILKVFQDAWEKANDYSWDDDEEPGSNIPILKIAADGLE